jgi:NAD(P)-dependent dehydrogenase (short-subunit alcohol dehydrogenase family)
MLRAPADEGDGTTAASLVSGSHNDYFVGHTVRDFSDHVAVVTGAASGIGRQLAQDLVARGAEVVGIDVQDAPDLRGVRLVRCDLSDLDAFTSTLQHIEKEHDRIDLLANVAGIDRGVSATENDRAVFERILRVNFVAPLTGTLAVVPGMVSRRRGYVLNVSSDSVRSPIAGASAYIASKGALSGFTESAALELKPKGVHLHVLYPGFLYTAMGKEAIKAGLKPPPRIAVRTPAQVSALVLKRLGGQRIEINAAPITLFTPILKSFTPGLYRRMMTPRAMPVPGP